MSVAWMYPGQGSQYPGMGQRLLSEFAKAREVLREAEEYCGIALSQIRERGPAASLTRPAVAEPLITALQIAYTDCLLEAGRQPAVVAGYSAGETAAFYAAGVLSRSDALRVAAIRGAVLENYVDIHCKMINVTRLGVSAIVDCLDNHFEPELHRCDLAIAGWNAPDSVTIVGKIDVVRRVGAELQGLGAIVADVDVLGPWHTARLQPASALIRRKLREVKFSNPTCLLFVSATGNVEDEPDALADALSTQVATPVMWLDIMENWWLSGVREVFDIGPGRTLLGMLRRNWTNFADYQVLCVESASGNITTLKRLINV